AYYDVPTPGLFNSFITKHQANTAELFGYLGGTNYLVDKSDGTACSNFLAGTEWICLSEHTVGFPKDLDAYTYVGRSQRFMFFHNENAASAGLWLPAGIETIHETDPVEQYNALGNLYGIPELFTSIETVYEGEDAAFTFEDVSGKELTFAQAKELYETETGNGMMSEISALKMHISFEAPCDGQAYICGKDISSLGRVFAGERFETIVSYPNALNDFAKEYRIVICNEEAFTQFVACASPGELREPAYRNNALSGKVSCKEEGYVMLPMAYSSDMKVYVDGEEGEVEDLWESVVFVKMPAGDHTVKLVFDPAGYYRCILFSVVVLLFDMGILLLLKRKKNEGQA
ncbi:MAG: YfhO family protein, partial [Lachnospiraceae bacterium]|nr:YfhO family protein [Lachnospiraceae bacterium]